MPWSFLKRAHPYTSSTACMFYNSESGCIHRRIILCNKRHTDIVSGCPGRSSFSDAVTDQLVAGHHIVPLLRPSRASAKAKPSLTHLQVCIRIRCSLHQIWTTGPLPPIAIKASFYLSLVFLLVPY